MQLNVELLNLVELIAAGTSHLAQKLMIKYSLVSQWLEKTMPIIESLAVKYQTLSQEQQIWLWIAFVTAIILTITVVSYLIYRIFKGLNNLLQSPNGWRPINLKNWMWVGTGIWLVLIAHRMQLDQNPGWSVAAVCGTLVILGFGWFMAHRLKWWQAIGAFIANSCVGIIFAPVVIQSIFLYYFSSSSASYCGSSCCFRHGESRM